MEIVSEADERSTEAVPGVELTPLAGGEQANVQHFVVEAGAVVPEHSHPHEQVGYLLDGALAFDVDGDSSVLPSRSVSLDRVASIGPTKSSGRSQRC